MLSQFDISTTTNSKILMIIFNVSNKFLQTNMSLSRDVRFFLKAQNLKLELTARTRKSEPSAMLVVFRVQVSGHT